MNEPSQPYNLHSLRKLLIAAFDTKELRALVAYDDTLSSLVDEFAPTDAISTMVDKTISWCDRRALLPYLVQLVKEERPEKYKLVERDLVITGAEQPQEEEAPGRAPEIVTVTSPVSLDLVRIPAGEFLMGSVAARDEQARDDEFPQRRVHVPEFFIGQYPMTNLQYYTFVMATERAAPYHWKHGRIGRGKENHPVIWVSWIDAAAFCDWLRIESGEPFRLPTEAEWEKAARGTDGRIYPWGDEPPDESRCNFDRHADSTTPIGRYSPRGDSPYGCADMAGNVWEWCQNLYRPCPYRVGVSAEVLAEDMLTVDGRRVIRGGSSSSSSDWVRCACRSHFNPTIGYRPHGFRVARGPLGGISAK